MKRLFDISLEEKNRILEMHQSATKNNYLFEQNVNGDDETDNFDSVNTPVKKDPKFDVPKKIEDSEVEEFSKSISHLKDKLMDELSDGQRQKVMIAKSLAQQTPIIILDEPTAFLDYTSKHKLFEDLKNLCLNEKKLIIVSSHDIDLMKKYITNSLHLKENNYFELA